MTNLRALFHTPYFDSLGGGERYILTLMSLMQQAGYQIDVVWNQVGQLQSQAKSKFNLSLASLGAEPSIFNLPLHQRYAKLKPYSVVFTVSDGSLPLLIGSRHNIVHFQVPFHGVNGHSLVNQFKKRFINHFISNSNFTKDFVDQEYHINSHVIYPPVDVGKFSPTDKKNQILYVGRFSTLMQDKGHLQLIEAFKKFYDSGVNNYRLWLAGSTEIGADSLISHLKRSSRGYPIEFLLDPPFTYIKELYEESRFFWSLAGVSANESRQPERCEHFGITLVEAMASGCIPLTIRKGGFREIITPSSGILCDTQDELIIQTKKLITQPKIQYQISQSAQKRARHFSIAKFKARFQKIIPYL